MTHTAGGIVCRQDLVGGGGGVRSGALNCGRLPDSPPDGLFRSSSVVNIPAECRNGQICTLLVREGTQWTYFSYAQDIFNVVLDGPGIEEGWKVLYPEVVSGLNGDGGRETIYLSLKDDSFGIEGEYQFWSVFGGPGIEIQLCD